jgi:hypothetical protein
MAAAGGDSRNHSKSAIAIRNAARQSTKTTSYIVRVPHKYRHHKEWIVSSLRASQVTNHHFKWWFDIDPIRVISLARLKGGVTCQCYQLPL